MNSIGPGKLRTLLSADRLVVAPGAYDCIGSRAIERAGFDAVYMTGAGVSAAYGFPDYGLLSATEMSNAAGRMAASINLPLIADADTGYGNELNVIRTVRDYERLGVAALHIEDQAHPKKCGHLDQKQLVGRDEFISKIRAATFARRNPDFLIIARTDARAGLGLEEAIARSNAALEAGADLAFVEAPQSEEEIRAIPTLVRGPCMLNMVWAGRTPIPSLEAVADAGYRLAILPGLLLGAVVRASEQVLQEVCTEGRHADLGEMSPQWLFARFGAGEWNGYRADLGLADT